MSLRKYASYKDSGIAWLGKVPAHWEVKPLKYLSRINKSVLSESTDPDYEFDYVDIGSVSPELRIAKDRTNEICIARLLVQDVLVQEGDVYCVNCQNIPSGDCTDKRACRKSGGMNGFLRGISSRRIEIGILLLSFAVHLFC